MLSNHVRPEACAEYDEFGARKNVSHKRESGFVSAKISGAVGTHATSIQKSNGWCARAGIKTANPFDPDCPA